GFVTGLVHFVSLVYWAAYTMKIYGHLPLYLCIPLLILLAAYLAIYPALFAGLTTFIQRPVWLLICIPVFWTASEYLRATLFTGFPWELLGYSQYSNLPFIQIADITGIYGISFWLALINAAVLLASLGFRQQRWQAQPVSRKGIGGAGLAVLVMSGFLWGYGQSRIHTIDGEATQVPRRTISVLQGNIVQNKKWNQKFQKATLQKYIDLSLQAGRDKPDLIVWPETATPFFIGHNHLLTDLLQAGIRRTNTDHLIGTPTAIRHNGRTAYHNSAALFSTRARVVDQYEKVHLVPFGEYVPFKKWLPFIGKLVAQVGDFIPGTEGKAITWQDRRIGVLICYEIIFPTLSRAMVQNKTDILVNITNDAWFGKTSAPRQHFSMAVFRAIENRRALVRSANTGISGFIDPVGRIINASELNTAATLTGVLPLMTTTSIYTNSGDIFALGCLIVTLLVVGWVHLQRYRRREA
ncbi:MAG: apolipoprotein N-acyltransferase, partial [Desulfobacterales bacterium]|nr:apolipoprotein N-acyltransferase [Desulfobacterales bacterium]